MSCGSRRGASSWWSPAAGTRLVTLNTAIQPFDDLDVRKAVLAGFDREALRLTRGGAISGRLATHFLPPAIPGFEDAGGDEGPDVDFLNTTGKPMPDVSAAYFRKAGHGSGRYAGNETVLVVGGNAADARQASLITKQSLESMGFKVRLRLVSYETSFTRFCGVPAAAVAVYPNTGWARISPTSQTLLDAAFNGANIRPVGNTNMSQLDVPAVNAAIEQAKAESGAKERAQAWGAVDRLVTAEAPAIPWSWDNALALASADVALEINSGIGGVLDLNFARCASAESGGDGVPLGERPAPPLGIAPRRRVTGPARRRKEASVDPREHGGLGPKSDSPAVASAAAVSNAARS